MGFNQGKAEAFANRLVRALNEGALCLMTSVGHRSGLFDVMAELQPSTSEEIATVARLNERYVREWLGAMTTGGFVEYEEATGRYSLPKEHAAYLTRKATPNNLATFTQYIPLLGSVEDDIVQCFKSGGGVPYARYPRFHTVMAEDSGQSVLGSLFEQILPLVPGLTERLEDGIRVLDVGCGSGMALNMMARRFPNSRFLGYDISEEGIRRGLMDAKRNGLTNVRFEMKDLSQFDLEGPAEEFDFITTFDAVHDQARPRSVLRGIHRALKSDGIYLMQDIYGSSHVHKNMGHPVGPFLYTVSCLHCMTVSLAQGGEGLGAMWGEEKTRQLLQEAGFCSVEMHRLEHDIQNAYYVIRK